MQFSKNIPAVSQTQNFLNSKPAPFRQIVLSQVVGVAGFEPATLRLSSACSNQLSYTPL